jgi:hypothetical protein
MLLADPLLQPLFGKGKPDHVSRNAAGHRPRWRLLLRRNTIPQKLDSSPRRKSRRPYPSQELWRECLSKRIRSSDWLPRIVVPRLGCDSAFLWLRCTSRKVTLSMVAIKLHQTDIKAPHHATWGP